MLKSRKNIVFVILIGFFITNAVVAEIIGVKLIYVGNIKMSIGILPWPVVFLVTDLLNEFYGKEVVKKISFITAGLISYVFVIILISLQIPAVQGKDFISDEQYNTIFGQSQWIIVGSIVAFLVSQLFDAHLFKWIKDKTNGKHIWLRSTGSTVFSQFIDSFVVLGIAFYLPGIMTFDDYIKSGFTGYAVKLFIAFALTPLIYLAHHSIKKYINHDKE